MAKLTKRQKKSIAFRERKHKKSKDGALDTTGSLEDDIDVPSLENQALVTATQGQQGGQTVEEAFLGRGKAGKEAEAPVVVGKKRRRKTSQEAKGPLESDNPTTKRRRGPDGSPIDGMEEPVEDHVEVGEAGRKSEKTKHRFILFLGNLKYTTTPEAIQAHFSVCVPPPTIRLLTLKPSVKSVAKSKGCAFLEFKHRGALQQGLRLHRSMLDGRQINVELTAGGGGKGLARTKKLRERNKELEGQRRKRQDSKTNIGFNGPQRFSATSSGERTWTVDLEKKGTHQGGQKHRSKKRPLAREFRTGVNAIPVG